MHRTIRTLAAGLVLAGVLTACSSDDDESSADTTAVTADEDASANDGDTPGGDVVERAQDALEAHRQVPGADDIPVTTALDEAPPAKRVVIMRCEIPNCNNVSAGLEDAAAALGWDVELVNSLTSDPAAGWDQAFAADPDYIITYNGLPTSAYSEQLEQAKAADIPVFACYGTDEPTGAEGNGIYSQCADASTSTVSAEMYGDSIIADSDGEAHVLHVFLREAGAYVALNDALSDYIGENCPDCTYDELEVSFADIRAQTQGNAVVSFLQANPDVTHIIVSFSTAWGGTVDALRTAGLLDSVDLLTSSPASVPQPFEDLASGEVTGAVLAEPASQYISWTEMDAAARFSVGADMSEERLSAVKPIYLIDSQEAAQAWVDDPWEGPEGYEDYFKGLWQVAG